METAIAASAPVNSSSRIYVDDDFFYAKETGVNLDTLGPWQVMGGNLSPVEVPETTNFTDAQGVLAMLTTGGTGSTCVFQTGPSFYIGRGPVSLRLRFSWNSPPDGTNNFVFRFGLASAAFITDISAALANALTFKIDYTIASLANFYTETRSASVGSPFNTGVAVPTGIDTFRVLRIDINSNATQIDYYIDNVLVRTETTGIPSTTRGYRAIFGMTKTLGVIQKPGYVDRFTYDCLLTTPRPF
jgi:hypothetical protein